MNITLVCEDTFDGMMSAVYESFIRMNKGDDVHVIPGNVYEYNFLTTYVDVDTNSERAKKVIDSIRKKISLDAYMLVYRCCMHYKENRVDIVIEFLKKGYKKGASITKDFGDASVMNIVEYSRKCSNEAHLFKGFVRFKELEHKVLFARISPKCDVLGLISHHFENRYPMENWIIYDDTRKKALVHKNGGECITIAGEEVAMALDKIDVDDKYEDLWKLFFNTIAIKQRENPKCQNTHLPLWYRQHMPEV